MHKIPDTWLPTLETAIFTESRETTEESSVATSTAGAAVKSEHAPKAEGTVQGCSSRTRPLGPTIDEKTQAELLVIANEPAEDTMSEHSTSESHKPPEHRPNPQSRSPSVTGSRTIEDIISEVLTAESYNLPEPHLQPSDTSIKSENPSPSHPASHKSLDDSLLRWIKVGVKRSLSENYFSYDESSKRQRQNISLESMQLDEPTRSSN